MMKVFLWLFAAISFVVAAQTAKIKIDIDQTIVIIYLKIYGVFTETIHFNGKRMGLPDTVDFNSLYGNLIEAYPNPNNNFIYVEIPNGEAI